MTLPSIPTIPRSTSPCITRGCSACCHDTEMLLTNDDILRLSVDHADEPFWHEVDGYLMLRTKDAPPAPGQSGRPCWFLSADGRCTVHEARPEGCRLYPAIYDVDAMKAILDDEHCPHTDGFRLPQITADAVARLARRLQDEADARAQQA